MKGNRVSHQFRCYASHGQNIYKISVQFYNITLRQKVTCTNRHIFRALVNLKFILFYINIHLVNLKRRNKPIRMLCTKYIETFLKRNPSNYFFKYIILLEKWRLLEQYFQNGHRSLCKEICQFQ